MSHLIVKPVISEKSFDLAKTNVYLFSVPLRSNKVEIARTIHQIFDVDVINVRTAVAKGKTKKFRGTLGKRNDSKKAFVKLKEGQKIKIFETEDDKKKSKKKDK